MGKGKVIGKPGITVDLGELPNGSKVSYSAGFDIGFGDEALGGDVEATLDSEVQGINFSLTGAAGGLIGTVEFVRGRQGFRVSAN